jgi:hypothetical protein
LQEIRELATLDGPNGENPKLVSSLEAIATF